MLFGLLNDSKSFEIDIEMEKKRLYLRLTLIPANYNSYLSI